MGQMLIHGETMLGALVLLSSLPQLLADHGVIILGGQGPDGPLDTVSVLTESGWCPQENVIIPPLPMAAEGLTAHHGQMVGDGADGEREYLMVCGFPEESACYQISPLNGHYVWTPVETEEDDLDMDVLEYVHSYDNMIKGGVTSMWMNKNSGEFEFLYSPMHKTSPDAGADKMAGWYKSSVPNLVANSPSLGTYVDRSCLAQHPLSNVGDGDWQWHRNSI